MPPTETFQDWLRARCRERDWRARQLAKHVGVPARTAHSWLRGERRPRPEMLNVLLERLAIPAEVRVYVWCLYAATRAR